MITPGLVRRSLVRAAQWRLIVFQLVLLGISALVAVWPVMLFLQKLLRYWPKAQEEMARVDAPTLFDFLLQLGSPASSNMGSGFFGAGILGIVFAPLFASAILAVARSDETLPSRPLLQGAGENYGRMLRMVFAAAIPLAVAGILIAIATKWSSGAAMRATTEAARNGPARAAMVIDFCAVGLAALWLDAARAQFAAQPARRSAFLAVFAGGYLLIRRPLRAIGIGVITGVLSLGAAGIFLVLRQSITESSGGQVFLALILSQVALAFLSWGRAARLLSFVELARADQLDRKRVPQAFEMAEPKTSPPPPAAVAIQSVPATAQTASAPFSLAPPAEVVVVEAAVVQSVVVVIADSSKAESTRSENHPMPNSPSGESTKEPLLLPARIGRGHQRFREPLREEQTWREKR